jgi:hypothetical protein
MKIIAALGWVLACAASPSNAVVVIEPTTVAAHRGTGAEVPVPAATDIHSMPTWDAAPIALAITALIITIGVFSAVKQRSPRSVVA